MHFNLVNITLYWKIQIWKSLKHILDLKRSCNFSPLFWRAWCIMVLAVSHHASVYHAAPENSSPTFFYGHDQMIGDDRDQNFTLEMGVKI